MEAVDLRVFARAWAVHTRQVAWLLGAGTSAAAGLPTAGQIIDDLLLRLYADAFDFVRQSLDATDPAVSARIRAHYDGANGMPPAGSNEEYSAAFAAAMPDPQTRASYLRALLGGRRPCYGQRVLGAAIAAGHTDLVMTTNFDELVEIAVADARAAAAGAARSSLLTVAALDSAGRATAAAAHDGWPLLVKLHGDFREAPLKNLDAELRAQDQTLRRAVVDSSRRFGLAVAGYSGRDASVMEMLEEASLEPEAWPAGLWWLTRDPSRLPARVLALLDAAASRGVAAHAVQAENFDEAMAALAAQAAFDPPVRTYIDALRPRGVLGEAPAPVGRPAGRFPILRLNALPVLAAPSKALAVEAHGMTADELRQRLTAGGWRGAAVLGPGRVLALGRETELLRCLGADAASRADIDPLSPSARTDVMALTSEALARALARRLPAKAAVRERGCSLRIAPAREDEPTAIVQTRERIAAGYDEPLTGVLPARLGLREDGAPRAFAEAVRLRLDRAAGGLWLVFTPFTWTDEPADAAQARRDARPRPTDPAGDWKRERWVRRRRNNRWAEIIDAWGGALAPHRPTTTIHVLPRHAAAEPDAEGGAFALGATTAFSRPAS
jgi:hypothetical protein